MCPVIFFRKTFVSLFALVFAAAFFSCRSLRTEDVVSLSDGRNSTEENMQSVFLSPESFEEIDAGSRRCVFKTSSAKTALYINSEFQGYTPLEIDDLIPGFFFVSAKKDGFKPKTVLIQVQDGRADYYYMRLEPLDSGQKTGVNTESDTKK